MRIDGLNTSLMSHQQKGVLIALKNQKYNFFWDTGTGKTILGLSIFLTLMVKTLIVCPLACIEDAWMEDIKKYCPQIHAVNLRAVSTKKRERAIIQNDLILINFESFKVCLPLFKRAGIKLLIVDESSKIKSQKTQITKYLTKFSRIVPNVYLFSGTPAPNSYLEYYPQVNIVRPEMLGRSYWAFRNTFFYPGGYGGYDWKLRQDKEKQFLEKIKSCSWFVDKNDVLDLPERTFNIRSVILSSSSRKTYEEMKRNLIIELEGETVSAASAITKIMKLRQITAGLLYGEDKTIEIGKEKLDSLFDLLGEIGNKQVLIWGQFRSEINRIIKELGDRAVAAYGEVSSKQKTKNIAAFKRGDAQYLVAHPNSIGHGLTLTNASYAVYTSLSYSLETYLQSLDRIYRYGQENKCTYYFLLAQNTIDTRLYEALQGKKKISKIGLNFLK